MANPPDQYHAPSGSSVLPQGQAAQAPQTTWVLRSQIPSAPSDICCSGEFLPGPVSTVVMARGSWLELLCVATPNQGQYSLQSITCQPAFCTIVDLQALPTAQADESRHSLTDEVPRDLLLMLSDSGMLSVLMYSADLNRFVSMQQVLLAPSGLQAHTLGRQLRVSPDGGAVVVAACKNNLALFTVAKHGGSTMQGPTIPYANTAAVQGASLQKQLAAAMHAVVDPTKVAADAAPSPHAGTLVTVLDPEPLLYWHAGSRFHLSVDAPGGWQYGMDVPETDAQLLAAAFGIQTDQAEGMQSDTAFTQQGSDLGGEAKDGAAGPGGVAEVDGAGEVVSRRFPQPEEEVGQMSGEAASEPRLYAMENLPDDDQQQDDQGEMVQDTQDPSSMEMGGLQAVLMATELYEGPEEFTIWDVAWLGSEAAGSSGGVTAQHQSEGRGGAVQDRWLLCLTHRPGSSHSDLTLLHWQPQQRLVHHAARLTLPHSSPLGVPTQLKPVPKTSTGVVVVGTSSLLLLDCTHMITPAVPAPPSTTLPLTATATGGTAGGIAAAAGGAGGVAEGVRGVRKVLEGSTQTLVPFQRALGGGKAAACGAPGNVVGCVQGPTPTLGMPPRSTQGIQVVPGMEQAAWQQAERQQPSVWHTPAVLHGHSAHDAPRVLAFHSLGPYAETMVESIAAWLKPSPKETSPSQAAPKPTATGSGRQQRLSSLQSSRPTSSFNPPTTSGHEASHGMAAAATHGMAAATAEADTVLSAGRSWQHVAMCATWLQQPTAQHSYGSVHGASSAARSHQLIVSTSTGVYLALTVHVNGAPAASPQQQQQQQQQQQADAYSVYRAQLPASKLSFTCCAVALEPAGLALEPPTATVALADNLLLCCCSHISSRYWMKAAVGRPMQAAPVTAAVGPHCPAVCFQPCVTPGAQWSATYYACMLQQCLQMCHPAEPVQQAETGSTVVSAGSSSNTCTATTTGTSFGSPPLTAAPSRITMTHIGTQSELGPLHGCVMGHRGGSHGGRVPQLYVTTCQCTAGGGTLTVGGSTGRSHDRNARNPEPGHVSSRLSAVQGSVPCTPLASWPAGTFPAATGMWPIRARATDTHDTVLMISFLAATRALAVGTEMCDITDVLGVSSCEATVMAGLVAEGLMVQVTSTAVYLLNMEPAVQNHNRSDTMFHREGAPAQSADGTSQGYGQSHVHPMQRSAFSAGSQGAPAAPRPRLVASTSQNKFSRLNVDAAVEAEALLLHPTSSEDHNTSVNGYHAQGLPSGSWTVPEPTSSGASAAVQPQVHSDMCEEAVGMMVDEEEPGTPVGSGAVSMSIDEHTPAAIRDPVLMSPSQMSPLHNAMRNLAVAANSATTDGASENEPGNQMNDTMECASHFVAHDTISGSGSRHPGGSVADQDPCVWRPGSDVTHSDCMQQGVPATTGMMASHSQDTATGHILTAAVSQGCVVLQQAGSHTLQVLSVICESEKAPHASSSTGPAPRKRRRPAHSLQHAGCIPWHTEVSCMQLIPEVRPSSCMATSSSSSHHQQAHAHTSTTHRAYFLLLGHRQPGVALLRVVVAPRGPQGPRVQHQLLCHAGPPPMSGLSLQGVWEPPSAALAVIPHSLLMTYHTTSRERAHSFHHTSGLVCETPCPSAALNSAAQSNDLQQPQLSQLPSHQQMLRHRRQDPAVSSMAAHQALTVVLQWLVGFRKGMLALYQWVGDPTCPEANTVTVGHNTGHSPAQLLWVVDLGTTPLTLVPFGGSINYDDGSNDMKVQGTRSPSGPPAGSSDACTAQPEVPICYDVPTLVIGDATWLVSVHEETYRVKWLAVDVGDTPLTLAASITLPRSDLKDADKDPPTGKTTDIHSHSNSPASGRSTDQVAGGPCHEGTALLLGVHNDTSWRLQAVGACGAEVPVADGGGATMAWWSHLCPASGQVPVVYAQQPPTQQQPLSQQQPPTQHQPVAQQQPPSQHIAQPAASSALHQGTAAAVAAPGTSQNPGCVSWELPPSPAVPRSSSTSHLPHNWVTQETLTHAPTRSLILLGGYQQNSNGLYNEAGSGDAPGQFVNLKQGIAALDAETGRLMGLHQYSWHDTPTTMTLWTTRVAGVPTLSDVVLPPVSLMPMTSQGTDLGEPSSPVYRTPLGRLSVPLGPSREVMSHPVILTPPSSAYDQDGDTSAPPSPTVVVPASNQGAGAAFSPTTLQYKQLLVVGFGSQDVQRPRLQGRIRVYQLLRYTMQYKGSPNNRNQAQQKAPAHSSANSSLDANGSRGVSDANHPAAGSNSSNSSTSSRSVMVWREEAELKLPGKVGALCALGPGCLVAVVDQRLACFTLQGGQLTKLGSLPTRSTITLLSGCSSTRLVAGADCNNGVTLFLCDPQAQEPASVLQVVAADTLPRPITSLLLLPNSMLNPLSPYTSPAPPPISGAPNAPSPASPMMSPTRQPPAGLPSAPQTPGDQQGSAISQAGLLGIDLQGHKPDVQQLLLTAPVTILAADATGCLTLLKAEAITLPPVRNLVPAGMFHLNDLCTQLVLGSLGASSAGEGASPWTQQQQQQQSTGALALLNCVASTAAREGVTSPHGLTLPHSHHSLLGLAAMAGSGSSHNRVSVSAACASGALMTLLEVTSSPAAALLGLLEGALAALPATQPVSGWAYARYRGQYQLDALQTLTEPESRAVLDGDLLETFLDLPWALKRHVVTQILHTQHAAVTLLTSAAALMMQAVDTMPARLLTAGESGANARQPGDMVQDPGVMLSAATLLMTHLLQQVMLGG